MDKKKITRNNKTWKKNMRRAREEEARRWRRTVRKRRKGRNRRN